MAGFGTAGSMLAGAAVLFVLASAIVAFHGLAADRQPGLPGVGSAHATPRGTLAGQPPAAGCRVSGARSRARRTVVRAGASPDGPSRRPSHRGAV